MKKIIFGFVALCLGLAVLHGERAHAGAGYRTEFEVPQYQLNQTVIGVEGWKAGTITTGNNDDARIVEAPWGGTALHLRSSVEPGKAGTVAAIQDFGGQKIEGNLVKVEVILGFDFKTNGADTNVTSRIYFGSNETASSTAFGMSLVANGGLYYVGGDGTVTILPKSEVKPLSPYKFTLVLDFEQKVFDLTVSGVKRNDEAFEFTVSGVAFRGDKAANIPDIRFSQNSPALSGYMSSLLIEPIPEPSGIVLLSIAGGSLLAICFGRKR